MGNQVSAFSVLAQGLMHEILQHLKSEEEYHCFLQAQSTCANSSVTEIFQIQIDRIS